ncbi:hypothetical protein J9B83_11890 [Marinomonas sp. A79]|uniref:Periplasmic binding protein domain-containing protein n=1 Tax=Marinomonas vulgaris TaxID=2823372 RepID=A0ABS5HE12_9GAMM|nr:hypothetical protein [Marinomonas vulgaris]MBR7889642.1 hypothetical protein [Marinomonas vulgaris]
MKHRYSFIIWIVCIFASTVTHSAGMTLDLMDSQTFYKLMPRQGPLAEQFSAIVHAPPNPIRITQKRPVQVALVLFGDVESIDNKALLNTFRRRMREINIDYRLDIYVDASPYSMDMTPYVTLVKAQPDYIVMTKLGFVQRRFLERFLRSGSSKVIVYDFASPLTHWLNHPPLMYLGFDQKKVTTMLADFLHRQLPVDARIAAVVLPSGYLSHTRCDFFLDKMMAYHRRIDDIYMVPNETNSAFNTAQQILEDNPPDFIFSCSHAISEGVSAALVKSGSRVQTNGWGVSSQGVRSLIKRHIAVSALFTKDDASIAIAEAIKLDLEGRNMPNLYVANATLMPSNLHPDVLRFMMQHAYTYSVSLWR